MVDEELKAKIASIKNFEDAYKMACEGGYKGTADEFATLVENAADEVMPMDLDAMENVAGGGVGEFVSDSWDHVTSACSKAAAWVKENPELTAGIVGGVALVGVAIGTSVVAYKHHKANLACKGNIIQAEPDMKIEVTSDWVNASYTEARLILGPDSD